MSWLKLSVLVGALASAWLVDKAHARFGEGAVAFGEALAGLSHPSHGAGHETAIVLNGQAFRLASLSSEDAPSAVLARAERALSQGFALRYQASEGAGVVLGLDAGSSSFPSQWLRGRSSSAGAADAGSFGLRYVFVRPAASGGSHVLVAWTEGRLELGAMFPASGDASGSDVDGLPRPPGAVRLLSARVPHRGYALAAYRVAGEPDAALERYADQLRHGGVRVVRLGPQRGSVTVMRGQERAFVHSFRQGGHSVIALVRAGEAVPSQEGNRGE